MVFVLGEEQNISLLCSVQCGIMNSLFLFVIQPTEINIILKVFPFENKGICCHMLPFKVFKIKLFPKNYSFHSTFNMWGHVAFPQVFVGKK